MPQNALDILGLCHHWKDLLCERVEIRNSNPGKFFPISFFRLFFFYFFLVSPASSYDANRRRRSWRRESRERVSTDDCGSANFKWPFSQSTWNKREREREEEQLQKMNPLTEAWTARWTILSNVKN
jgi:hypothetical protein